MVGSRHYRIVLAVQASALIWGAWRMGVTIDEPSHLARAHAYWLGRTDVFPHDTTPLTLLVGGWVPRLLGAPIRRDTDAWKNGESHLIGHQTLGEMRPAAARRLVFLTRLTHLVFPLLTVWLLWRWASELFDPTTAWVIAACAALEPTLLGHGPLLKSDVAAACAFVLFCYQAWRYWRRPDLRSAVGLVIAVLVAVLAKFSLLVCVPAAAALFLWRGPRLRPLALLISISYLVVLAGYQFRHVRPIPQAEYQLMQDQGFTAREVAVARVLGRISWPEPFVRGLRYLGGADRNAGFPAYMLGRRIEYAAPWYFPLAWAIKFPIALQLLTVGGLAVLGHRLIERRASAADAFIWVPTALLVAVALRSHIHMGLRHILPVLPMLVLGSGFAVDRLLRSRAGRVIAGVGLLWLAAAAAWIHPNGLAYFNEWVGGPRNGWKYLADSNLDWGQGLPELARYVAAHQIEKIRISYFGFDIPEHYIPAEKIENLNAPWDPQLVSSAFLEPQPGVYAISVNLLLGYFFSPEWRGYFARFRDREPDARAGWGIFIYHVK